MAELQKIELGELIGSQKDERRVQERKEDNDHVMDDLRALCAFGRGSDGGDGGARSAKKNGKNWEIKRLGKWILGRNVCFGEKLLFLNI